MKIGLRIFLGYFLIVGLAGFFVMRIFVNEVKPGVRQSMEATLVDTANVLAELAAGDMREGRIGEGAFAHGVDALVRRDVNATIWNFRKRSFDYRIYVTDAEGIVRYDSAHQALGQDYSRWNDVYLTLRGKYGARSTRSDPADDGSSVMYVAAPIRDGEKIIGVLTVAKANSRIEPFIHASQMSILRQGGILLLLSLLVGVLATWWLARSLASLVRYAKAVTAGERAPAPELGRNEIGDLGRALATMRERLEGKQYVEQYVQTLAHEMKSPLAAIRGAAEILEQSPPEADRERFLRNIDSQSRRLTTMIDRMLALAAVETRQGLGESESLDLAALLGEMLAAAEPRFRQKGLRVEMGADAGPAWVRGDRFLLGQAIANLLDNAIDFSPTDGRVGVMLRRESANWSLYIEDEGPGIPGFAFDRVFERFYSLPRPDGSRSSGIGLSFVKEVAALHRGSALLANAATTGARAELHLPAA